MLLNQPVRQIAYYVDDVHAAALRHVAAFGSGPFFTMELPRLPAVYRGRPCLLDQTAAVGQWGAMQVELIQENGYGPSILHEMYPPGSGHSGLHHMALFVDDLEEAVSKFATPGFGEAMRVTPEGLDMCAVFIDTLAAYGHFTELYEPVPALTGLYAHVAAAAENFDGSDPVRSIRLD